MNPFKGRHFQRDIILWAVRWYCKYGISYRELQEMLAERGVNVDHSTIYRWVQRYAPEMEKRLRWYWRNPSDLCPWHMDETYVKVNGRWAYLYRAVDSRGRTVDFYLSSRRNRPSGSEAAYRFLGKILNNVKHRFPLSIDPMELKDIFCQIDKMVVIFIMDAPRYYMVVFDTLPLWYCDAV